MTDPLFYHSAGYPIHDSTVPPRAWFDAPFCGLGGQQELVPSNSSTLMATSSSSPRKRSICPHCGRCHSRPVRDRACSNRHTHHYPFPCGGVCGNATCLKAFPSSERRSVHIQGRVPCEKCGKMGWKKNASRHRARCGF